jgi:3-oxoacyl-[acyl-carrier-protein] synthase III
MIIESLGVYLPERLVATADILKDCRRVPAGPFQRLTGIERRPVAGPTEYSIDLARCAVDRCLRLSRHPADAIDLVICCNISRCDGPNQRMSIEPTTSSRLCAEFGFSAADAFDISNACAGTFTGLLLAQTAFAAGSARRALVVSGEHITHLAATAQREINSLNDPRLACLTLGDSGVAILVEANDSHSVGFQAIDLFTLGQFSDLCIGSLTDRPHGGAIMLTQSRQLTQAAIEHCTPHAPATVVAHGWDPERIDAFITHQTAKLALQRARTNLNRHFHRTWLRDDNFVCNVKNRGNLATNSHFVALYDRAQQGRLQNGQRVVFSIAASGLTGGTALYGLDDLPQRLRQKLNGYAMPSGAVHRGNFWNVTPGIRISGVGLCERAPKPAGVVEMATAAAHDCLARAERAARDVDVLIYCGVYRERLLSEPAVAAMVAGALGMSGAGDSGGATGFAFDIFDGTIGFIKALQCASQMIVAGRARRAMIVASELPGDPSVSVRGAEPIMKVASAALVERANDGAGGFESFFFRSAYDLGESRRSFCEHADDAPQVSLEEDERFKRAAEHCVAESIEEVLGPQRQPADWCLLLGRHGLMLKSRLQRLGVRLDRILSPQRSDGDLFTSSLVHAWQSLERSPDFTSGARVLIVQAGSGLRVGGAVYVNTASR